MNNNYIIYNDLGLLEKQSVNPVSMGNNYTDLFYFAFRNKGFRECYLTFTATLPDGTNMPSAATTPITFEYEGVKYDGYLMRLSNAYTEQAGTLTFTLRLKENKTNMVLCSTQLTLEIHDSDVVTPTSITESEKDQILQAIADGNRELNEKKVDKDFTPYVKLEHAELGANDTLVVNHNNEIYKIEAKDFYNEVNGKKPDENGVININSNDIPYKDTEKSVSDELDDKLSKKDNIVRYKREYEENMPDIIVDKANMAVKDQKGNIIDETYINNEFLQKELNKKNNAATIQYKDGIVANTLIELFKHFYDLRKGNDRVYDIEVGNGKNENITTILGFPKGVNPSRPAIIVFETPSTDGIGYHIKATYISEDSQTAYTKFIKGWILAGTSYDNKIHQTEWLDANEHPIGSCYLCDDSINPNDFLNGTWENVGNILSTINVWKRSN